MTTKALLISHQLDYSGAPIALLDLATALKECGVEVTVGSFRPGPLANEYARRGILLKNTVGLDFDFCIANTVLSIQRLVELKGRIPKLIGWVHESPTFHKYNNNLSFDNIPGHALNLLLGVADFQVEYLKSKFNDLPVIRFDNTFNCANLNIDRNLKFNNCLSICLIGSLEKRKGLSKIKYLLNRVPPDFFVCLELIGVDIVEIQSLFAAAVCPPWLKINAHGKISRMQTCQIIASSDFYVSLSEDEVKPLTVLEASMLGVPSILSIIPAHKELFREIGNVILSSNPIETAIGMYKSNHTDVSKSKENQEFRYGWDGFKARTLMLLEIIKTIK